jgi:hypothetical protein
MIKTTARILAACSCVLLALSSPRAVRGQEGLDAIVEEIRGTVFWRQYVGARQERLDPKTQIARRVHPDEQVRLTRGSVLRLRLGRESILVPAGGWFQIPRRVLPATDPLQKMVKAYAEVGGVPRASPLQVFSPADNSVALPKPFIIRWLSTAPGCKLSLVITDVVRRRVGAYGEVEGSSGSFTSGKVEQDLLDYRAKFGEGPLELRAFDSCGTESHVSFSLLGVRGETALRRDLAFWDKGFGKLITHLGRASVYGRYGMISRAAEEYEAALRVAPESQDLLLKTISANRLTGNLDRAGELKKRLEAGAGQP